MARLRFFFFFKEIAGCVVCCLSEAVNLSHTPTFEHSSLLTKDKD